jgi:hypothetical protein
LRLRWSDHDWQAFIKFSLPALQSSMFGQISLSNIPRARNSIVDKQLSKQGQFVRGRFGLPKIDVVFGLHIVTEEHALLV